MNTSHTYTPSRSRLRAFTLVEIMVVVTILGFVTIGLTGFMTDTTRTMLWSTNKSKITRDVRLFTMRISKETLGANTAYVYTSFAPTDRNAFADRKASGQSGDCLILVYTEPYPDIDSDKHYERIIAYFRAEESNGVGPVYRVEVNYTTPQEIDTSTGVNHFEDFLSTALSTTSSDDYTTVLELSKGLSDGRLFRAANNGTFIINGEIIHGNDVQEMTNTYNLTISPRG
jgi:prepilin-type N-terminal cleavage/methylation domain-containing protein